MVIFEEVNGKLVPHGSEEDINAYHDYIKSRNRRQRHSSLRSRIHQRSSAFRWLKEHSPLSRLDRYIIGKFLGTYFFSIVLIISIAVVFDFNENIDKFLALLKTYFDEGGYQIQFNCVTQEKLLAAKADPQANKDLIVRVAGFSAYFITLADAVQDEIIARTDHTW